MIAIGSCIGSGIFNTPAHTLKDIPHYGYALIPWILGGLATYLGALVFSELGARFPKSGGVYVYLKESYGPLMGFLYGWIILLIVNTGALAALSFAFADYLEFFFHLDNNSKKIIGISTVLGLSLINTLGVGVSQNLAKTFTGLKLFALFLIILLAAYILGTDSPGYLTEGLNKDKPDDLWTLILLAFVGVFWSFGGWHHATYLSGETINPKKNVPKAMLIGTLTVMIVYVLTILAYMSLAPLELLAASDKIAGDAVGNSISNGGKLVTVAITISIFGTIAIYTMTAPRIYYAMAKDKIFFSFLADIHPRFKTPYKAIIFQAIWACILILVWGSFKELITFVTFMDLMFMVLAGLSIFYFRKNHKDKPDFYLKAYPLVPIIYVLIAGAFVVMQLFQLNTESLAGLAILTLGIPTFILFNRKNSIS